MMIDLDRLERAGDLKQDLIEFGLDHYPSEYQRALVGPGDGPEIDEALAIQRTDRFVLQHRLDNGKTVIDDFVARRTDLSDIDREMILAWRDVVEQPLRIIGRDGDAIVASGLIDDLRYRIHSNRGPAGLRGMRRRWFIVARLVPLGDDWLLTGSVGLYKPKETDLVYGLASQLALSAPELAFRNPELLESARRLDRRNRELFIRLFGDEVVLVAGRDLPDRMADYWRFHSDERVKEAGADSPSPASSPFTGHEWPEELLASDTVAVIYDEIDGLGYYADYGLVADTFAQPSLAKRKPHRRAVLGYLNDDSVEPHVIRRLADENPDNATTVFRTVLKRPDFDWLSDGDDLLRQRNKDYYRTEPTPRIAPLTPAVAEWARTRGRRRGSR